MSSKYSATRRINLIFSPFKFQVHFFCHNKKTNRSEKENDKLKVARKPIGNPWALSIINYSQIHSLIMTKSIYLFFIYLFSYFITRDTIHSTREIDF